MDIPHAGAGGQDHDPDGSGDHWYRVPRQGRSQVTLDRFFEALEALLADHEFEDVSVADIARRADRTVGSFYGRFEDKDAILRALHDRCMAEDLPFLEETLDPERWVGQPPRDAVRQIVELFVVGYRQPRPSFRPIMVRGATDPDFRAQQGRATKAAGRAWRRFVTGAILDPGPDAVRVADLAFRYLVTRLDHELLHGPVVATQPSAGALTDELTDTVLDLLAVPGREAA